MTESALKPEDNLTHVTVALQALRGARGGHGPILRTLAGYRIPNT